MEIFWKKWLQVRLGGVIIVGKRSDEKCCMVFARGRGVLSWSLLERGLLTPQIELHACGNYGYFAK